tara:strand:+ start:187 stop:504 length:318 start_codon:yes stop_codon:yes gene_type:complete
MEYIYTVRKLGGKPVALTRNGKVIMGHDSRYDGESYIADRPESQAVTVAVNYFKGILAKATTIADVSVHTKASIRHAKKAGATISLICQNYALSPSVVKGIIRGA